MSLVALFNFSFSTQRRKGAKGAKKRFGNGFSDEQVLVRLTECIWGMGVNRVALFGFRFSTQRRKGAKDAKFFEVTGEKRAKAQAPHGRDITHKTLQKAFLCALCAFAPLRWISRTTIKPTTP